MDAWQIEKQQCVQKILPWSELYNRQLHRSQFLSLNHISLIPAGVQTEKGNAAQWFCGSVSKDAKKLCECRWNILLEQRINKLSWMIVGTLETWSTGMNSQVSITMRQPLPVHSIYVLLKRGLIRCPEYYLERHDWRPNGITACQTTFAVVKEDSFFSPIQWEMLYFC